MNFTDHKMIITNYETLEKALTINTVKSQTAVILIDHSTSTIFNKYSKKTSTIYITESQTAVILTDHSTKLYSLNVQKKHLLSTLQSHKQQ